MIAASYTILTAPVYYNYFYEEEIRRVLDAHIAELNNSHDDTYSYTIIAIDQPVSEITAASSFELVHPDKLLQCGMYRLAVNILDNNHTRETIYVRIKLRIHRIVAVAARDVLPGEIVTKDALIKLMHGISTDDTTVLAYSAVLGQKAKRAFHAGHTFVKGDVAMVQAVVKSSPVMITYMNNGITISVRGTALENGVLGEMIQVRNIKTGTVIFARIIDTGKVAVQ